MTEDELWNELMTRMDNVTKRVDDLIARNERNEAMIIAIIGQITPENVALGHTWLKRKIKEAIAEAREDINE